MDSNNSNVTNENKKGLLNSVKRLFKGKSASLTKEANDGNHDRVLFSSPVKSIANKTAQGAVKGLVTEIKAQIEENFGLEDMDLQEMSSNMTKGALEAGGRYVSKSLTPANVTLGTAVIAAAMITVSKASEGSIVGAAMSLCAVNLLSKAFQHANHKGNWQEKVATPATEETSRAH